MKSYLCIIGIFCALALVKCGPHPEMKECAQEVGLPEPEGRPKGPPNFDDPKVKCLHACMMKKKGDMVDGKVVTEKAIELLAAKPGGATDAVKAEVTECATKANEGKDECDVAGTFHKCMMEKHPKHQ